MESFIGVIGGRQCDEKTKAIAYETGKAIAHNGFGLVCGGKSGVMEAAARGCKEAGGKTLGIIPEDDPEQANPYIDVVIPTGMGIMRNLLVVRTAKALIAIGGHYGTLSEIAFALQLNKPIVGIGTWSLSDNMPTAKTGEEAVSVILKQIAV